MSDRPDPQSALLSPEEAAEYLHTTVRHLRRLTSERAVPFVKLGGRPHSPVRYTRADLDAVIEQWRVAARPRPDVETATPRRRGPIGVVGRSERVAGRRARGPQRRSATAPPGG